MTVRDLQLAPVGAKTIEWMTAATAAELWSPGEPVARMLSDRDRYREARGRWEQMIAAAGVQPLECGRCLTGDRLGPQTTILRDRTGYVCGRCLAFTIVGAKR